MFAPRGWISLHEIFYQVNGVFQNTGRFGSIKYSGDENFEVTWLFMQEAEEVAVCLPNGEVLPVSRTLIFTFDPYDNLNDHIDLMVGTVGSAHTSKHSSQPLSEFELRTRYGPFLHLPVVFRADDFADFCEQLETAPQDFIDPDRLLSKSTDPSSDLSPKAVSESIIHLFDDGKLVKFDEAKSQLADEMSVRQFRFAWNLARERRPDISKPGRKPRRTIS
jgi:hypothetical protein